MTKDNALTFFNTTRSFFTILDSSINVVRPVVHRMIHKRKLDVNSNCIFIFITFERKLCTSYRELTGTVYSLLVYEKVINGTDLFINVLNDHKPTFCCFTK